MRSRCVTLLLLATPLAAWAANTAYISDKLVIGVYAAASSDGERIAQLTTGDSVEVEARDQQFTQVRLRDGREGWIKTAYLSANPPASTQVPALQAELQKLRAAAQSTAEPAADSKRISELQAALDAANAELAARPAQPASTAPEAASSPLVSPSVTNPSFTRDELSIEPIGADVAYRRTAWLWSAVIAVLTFGIGCAVGWYALDRKLRIRYGGLRIY